MMKRELRLILGDQLNASHSWFSEKSQHVTYLIAELKQEATYTRHHIQKVCAFFAAMSSFAKALESAGHRVIYLTLDDTSQYANLESLVSELVSTYSFDSFSYQLPDEFRLREQLADFSTRLGVSVNAVETEHFYLTDAQLNDYFKQGKKHRLEHFYRKLRVQFDILMDDGNPLGGEWNYDSKNRNKLKAADLAEIPDPLLFSNDVGDILHRIDAHGIGTIGRPMSQLLWPINRTQSMELLQFFCKHMLPRFGKFQDAMTGKLMTLGEDHGWSLYHSRISFALNSKMISPHCVVDSAIAAFKQSGGAIDIAQIEGFVRQILGWREFIRGVYWANMPDYAQLNHLNAARDLPSWFWTGKTKMRCMSHAITQSLDFAYAHHIQRLMVTGNFCLLAGISPDQVDQWYLGIYIDAIEWVEMPNTRGMSQFADGGIVGSKAYAASGNYTNKMSDYCPDCHYKVSESTGEKACPLNSLYWQFMDQHQEEFYKNPRSKMVYSSWLKKTDEQRNTVLNHAQSLLENLDSL